MLEASRNGILQVLVPASVGRASKRWVALLQLPKTEDRTALGKKSKKFSPP